MQHRRVWPLHFSVDTTIAPLAPGDFAPGCALRFIEFQRIQTAQGAVTRVLYAQPDGLTNYAWPHGAALEPAAISLGKGIGLNEPASFRADRFELGEKGLSIDIDFRDAANNHLIYRLEAKRPWSGFRFAAPPGAGMHRPVAFFIPYLFDFDFLTHPQVFEASFNGQTLKHAKLPIWRHWRRALSLKPAREAAVIEFQADHQALLNDADQGVESTAEGALIAVQLGDTKVPVRLEFATPLPAIGDPSLEESFQTAWTICVDGDQVVSGNWNQWPSAPVVGSVEPSRQSWEIAIEVTGGWGGVPDDRWMGWITRFIAFLRNWPKAYHWRGVLWINPNKKPELIGRWVNTAPVD